MNMRAVWNGAVLAESDQCQMVEGNSYFPFDSLHQEYLQPSATHSTCAWKGEASYYDIMVNGQRNSDAAWYYPSPTQAAEKIKGYIAFWQGVEIRRG